MSQAYKALEALDRDIRAGRTDLLAVLDYLQTGRLATPYTIFSRPQIAAATANNVVPEPIPDVEVIPAAPPAKRETVKDRRSLR